MVFFTCSSPAIWQVVKQYGAISSAWLFFTRRLNALTGQEQAVAKGATQVPMFYYEGDNHDRLKSLTFWVTFLFALCFALPHMVTFAEFTPPSLAQYWLYIISITLMTGFSFIIMITSRLRAAKHTILVAAQNLAVGTYLLARLTFLTLGFVALGTLPPAALSDTRWPHFILFFIGT